jgi:hypothetical protein
VFGSDAATDDASMTVGADDEIGSKMAPVLVVTQAA